MAWLLPILLGWQCFVVSLFRSCNNSLFYHVCVCVCLCLHCQCDHHNPAHSARMNFRQRKSSPLADLRSQCQIFYFNELPRRKYATDVGVDAPHLANSTLHTYGPEAAYILPRLICFSFFIFPMHIISIFGHQSALFTLSTPHTTHCWHAWQCACCQMPFLQHETTERGREKCHATHGHIHGETENPLRNCNLHVVAHKCDLATGITDCGLRWTHFIRVG